MQFSGGPKIGFMSDGRLKEVVVDMFGYCFGSYNFVEKEVVCMGNELLEIHPRSMCFGCWVNLCCSCRILEVPTSKILVQPMLESLEGSGKSQGTMSSEGGFNPLACLG
jgi:hypothetical protein